MSTNFYISAEREIVVVKTGEKDTQTEFFDCWQTPSDVTARIMASDDKLEAYQDWVMSISRDEVYPVYDKNDWFCEGEPIGSKVVNEGKDHLTELDVWIEALYEKGYELEFSAW